MFCAKNIQIMFYECIDLYIFNSMLLISNNTSEIRITDCEFNTVYIFLLILPILHFSADYILWFILY